MIVSGVSHGLDTASVLQQFEDCGHAHATVPKFVLRLHGKHIFISTLAHIWKNVYGYL